MENLIGIQSAWVLKAVFIAFEAVTVTMIVKHIKD